MMDFKTAAIPLIDLGFKVFPLRPGTKEAFTPNGVYDATDEHEQIEIWNRECPTANVALGCGPDSGVMVLDVDKQHGGEETLRALVKFNVELPKAPMQQTPQGGFHLLLNHDPRIGNSVGSATHGLGPGLDIKSKGGYVVLAPSYWNGLKRGKVILPGGGSYKWVRAPRGNALPKMPDWMAAKLIPKPLPPFAKRRIELGDATIAQVVSALGVVSNNDYWVWVKMGMAIEDAFGDQGYDIWRNWSGAGYSEFSESVCLKKWQSFKGSGGKRVSIASVFYEARSAGADLTKIFKDNRERAST